MAPQIKARRRDGGEEYYSVVQDSSPKFSNIDDQRRKSEPENNYYIQVVDGNADGAKRDASSKESPYYMDVEEEGHSDYVINAIDGEPNLQSPKRQDSDNEYYSRVHTLNKTDDDPSKINNHSHTDDDNVYALPASGKAVKPKISNQESHKYSNIEAMKKNNQVANGKDATNDDEAKPDKKKKQKSVIYMNLRKFKR